MEYDTKSELRRIDEIEADVECLMCARVIGQLFGHRWRPAGEHRSGRTIANLTTYRDNDPGALPRPVWPAERFRCRHCGGRGYVGEIMVHSVAEDLPGELCPYHIEPRSGPGRRPLGCRCDDTRLAA
jgi:hypothetical protein